MLSLFELYFEQTISKQTNKDSYEYILTSKILTLESFCNIALLNTINN